MKRFRPGFLCAVLPVLTLAGLAGCPPSTVPQYTLTVAISGQGDVAPSGGTFDSGVTVSLTATPSTGWQFLSWGGDVASTQNPVSLVIDGNKTVTAQFVESSDGSGNPVASFTFTPTTGTAPLTVAFTDNSDLRSSPLVQRLWDFGDGVGVSAIANPSYTFTNPGAYSVSLTITTEAGTNIADKVVVVATPVVPTATVPDLVGRQQADAQAVLTGLGLVIGVVTEEFSATAPSGEVISQDPVHGTSVSQGSAVNLFISEGPQPPPTFSVIPASQTVSAAAGTMSFNVVTTGPVTLDWIAGVTSGNWLHVTTGGSGSGNAAINVSYDANTTGSLRTGAISALVITQGASFDPVTVRLIQQAPVLPTQFPLTTAVTGEGTVTLNPAGGTYDAGTSVTLTAAPSVGWSFDHWEGGVTGKLNPATLLMNAANNVTAVFVQNQVQQYTLTVNVSGQGTVNTAGGTYAAGTTVALTATPAAGWHFDHWFDASAGYLTGATSSTTITMDQNRTVTAFFVISQCQLTTAVSPANGGTITGLAGQGVYAYGTTAKLTASPNAGWRFDHWETTGAPPSSAASVSITMDADTTATAFFLLGQYTLNTSVVGGHGALAPLSGPQTANAVVTLTATPDACYRVKAWTDTMDGVAGSNTAHVTMSADPTAVSVEFELIPYALTLTPPTHGTLAATEAPPYTCGEVVHLMATAAAGYQVKAWTGADTEPSTAATNTVTMTADKTVAVEFDENEAKALRPTQAVQSPDGTKMLIGRADGSARLWELATGTVVQTYCGHASAVSSVAFSPDGTKVLTGSWDETAMLWDTATGVLLQTFTGHAGAVNAVAFSPDGTKVLTGSQDGSAKLWDAATGMLLQTFTGHASGVVSVAFSPDGTKVLTESQDGTAWSWDAVL